MVGIVIVSHSQKLAEGCVELAKMVAHEANIAPAGGMEDGGLGTSYEKIADAIRSVNTGDGVAVLMDMGSAVMTTEMVLDEFDGENVKMLDAPVVEGAVLAAALAQNGASLDAIEAKMHEAREMKKLAD